MQSFSHNCFQWAHILTLPSVASGPERGVHANGA
jgi:hypothetical protein